MNSTYNPFGDKIDLEKAIQITNFLLDDFSKSGQDDYSEALSIVLQELKYKDKQIDKLYSEKLELEDCKDEYEKGNLIPKKKIEDKIKIYKNMCARLGLAINKETLNMFDNKIKVLQELLEDR